MSLDGAVLVGECREGYDGGYFELGRSVVGGAEREIRLRSVDETFAQLLPGWPVP
jgi:hypothetical protein